MNFYLSDMIVERFSGDLLIFNTFHALKNRPIYFADTGVVLDRH